MSPENEAIYTTRTPAGHARLHAAGFTWAEIRALSTAVDPSGKPQPEQNLDSKLWKDILAKRHKFMLDVRISYAKSHDHELTHELYDRICRRFAAKGKHDVWDWLKITYQPRKKMDFTTAAKHQAANRVYRLRRKFA